MPRILAIAALVMSAACATAGATFRSGVGDRQLEHPPYYAGASLSTLEPQPRVAYFPITFQRGASQAEIFDPASDAGSSVAALLVEMNAFLDSLRAGARLTPIAERRALAPNVYFGCELDPSFDCVERGDSALGRAGTTMRLAVERPSGDWIAAAGRQLDSASASHALLITLEVGQYWTRQTGLLGSKSVELGTRHAVALPWVTSLETPVSVLQLTGALVGRDGQAVRIGAEGLLALRTPIAASGIGAQRLVTDQDVQEARTMRHADRPGQPLVWRVALCELMAQLAGHACES